MESGSEFVGESGAVEQSNKDGATLQRSRLKIWSRWKKSDYIITFELSVLIVLIATVWILFSLPIIFYYLSSDEVKLYSLIIISL